VGETAAFSFFVALDGIAIMPAPGRIATGCLLSSPNSLDDPDPRLYIHF
jgi:hypothetical protein